MSNIIRIPGMMDPHVHLRSMDWSHKGTFASETAAAVAGGYTLVLDMPNTSPSTVNQPALERKLGEIGAQAYCDWGVYFGASQDDNTHEFAAAFPHVCGLKIYCNATTGNLLVEDQALRRRIYEVWPRGKVIAVHAEGETVLDLLECVRQTGKFTHFCHISTAEEIGFLAAAKEEGLPISVGVCPHHLYLTEDDLDRLGAFGLMKPELKTQRDQDALWSAIQNGVVDVIESDHAPHTRAEKESDKPPYGVPGLETNLSLMLFAMWEGRVSLERVIEMVSTNPRKIFNIPAHPGTYTVVEINDCFFIKGENLWSAAKWTPFEGMEGCGRVLETWLRGEKIFDFGAMLIMHGYARNEFTEA